MKNQGYDEEQATEPRLNLRQPTNKELNEQSDQFKYVNRGERLDDKMVCPRCQKLLSLYLTWNGNVLFCCAHGCFKEKESDS